jgi:DNA-binding transcriptional regulator PaaX
MMGASKGMWHQTAVDIVSTMAQDYIQHHNNQAARGRDLMYLLKEITGAAVTPVAPTKAVVKSGTRPAAGTIPGRVLDIVGEHDEPMSMREILAAKHGAKEYHVTTAVAQLVKGGWLVATGATSTRRYSLPVKKSGRSK